MPNSQLSILNKLLWQRKSKWLLLGAVAGTFFGLLLLLCAVQSYLDFTRLLRGDANPGDQFVQINKKINLLNTLGARATFDEDELAALRRQPFVQKLAAFTSNEYRAGAYSDMLGFYTELFFEAVPTDFLDVHSARFHWVEGEDEVPILISKDYLALYNFGFAPSQGLPQLTPAMLEKLSMEIRIEGQGRRQSFEGRIVGFSERLNSILVPQPFMDWANANFGKGKGQPSRLILQVDNPMSKALEAFLKKNDYEVSAGRLIGSQFGVLLRLALSAIMVLGGFILLLSVLIFVLNFQLLIAQSAPDVRLLLETGHFPTQISGVLSRKFSWLFGLVVLAVFGLLLVLRNRQVNYFSGQGFDLDNGLDGRVWAFGAALSVLLIGLNLLNIRRSVNKSG